MQITMKVGDVRHLVKVALRALEENMAGPSPGVASRMRLGTIQDALAGLPANKTVVLDHEDLAALRNGGVSAANKEFRTK